MPISFAPTFKFAVGTDRYDLKRTPAWTDRVLYALHADPLFADLKPLYCMSVPELRYAQQWQDNGLGAPL